MYYSRYTCAYFAFIFITSNCSLGRFRLHVQLKTSENVDDDDDDDDNQNLLTFSTKYRCAYYILNTMCACACVCVYVLSRIAIGNRNLFETFVLRRNEYKNNNNSEATKSPRSIYVSLDPISNSIEKKTTTTVTVTAATATKSTTIAKYNKNNKNNNKKEAQPACNFFSNFTSFVLFFLRL